MRSAPSIAFDYRPSRRITAAATVIVALALVAPWLAALPRIGEVAISLVACAFGIVALRRFRTIRFQGIAYGARGWNLVDASGIERPADLVAHRQFGPWISLDFRAAGRNRFRVLLDADNSDAETRRRLMLLLARAEVVQTR
jgi:hypothetical protein